MANKNKVKFNISNVHYAPITIGEDGAVTYATPVALPGAVSINMDPSYDEELHDVLIAISVVAKRLAQKINEEK